MANLNCSLYEGCVVLSIPNHKGNDEKMWKHIEDLRRKRLKQGFGLKKKKKKKTLVTVNWKCFCSARRKQISYDNDYLPLKPLL